MALNWLEELVSQYFEMQGYLVSENIKVKMPKTEKRSVQGNSDIDVFAIGENEVVHIECQSWYGPSSVAEEKFKEQLIDRYVFGKQHLEKTYPFLNIGQKNYRRVFVTSGKPGQWGTGKGPWDRLSQHCNDNEIELMEINDIIKAYLKILIVKFPKKSSHLGKQAGITRFLMHLMHNDFLKLEIDQSK